MRDWLMGIDNGGTMVKAVLFDIHGREIASAAKKLTLLTPGEGMTERDMDELWSANCAVIKRAMEKAPGSYERVAGVACTGHGKGLYLWGKDGKPCGNGIVSTDSRAYAYPLKWQEDGTAEKAFHKTFQRIMAFQPAPLINYIKDHDPDRIANTKWIFCVKDYIRFRLTGEAYSEISDASGNGLLNNREAFIDKELLELLNIGDCYEKIPPLTYSTEVCGTITKEASAMCGLPQGIPVAGGFFDVDACALAMGITTSEYFCSIAGTWSINEYISKTPVTDGSVLMNTLYALPGYYLIEESSPTSAGNYEWFIQNFLEREQEIARQRNTTVFKIVDEIASSVPNADQDIIFLPYLFSGPYNPRQRAVFANMGSCHTRAHVIRAVLEGIALCHRVHVEKLLVHATPKAVRLAGGAARSEFWSQMFADVLGLPVQTVDTNELGALGCAIAAGVSAGIFADMDTAVHEMMHISREYKPQEKEHEIYSGKFAIFRKISAAMENA